MDTLFDLSSKTRYALCMALAALIVVAMIAAGTYMAESISPQGYSVTITQLEA